MSIWKENITLTEREQLHSDIRADVCVIGAGMAGLLTAYMLNEKGLNVVVIDANKTAGGVTQNTTAKITSQHGLIYSKLIREFGEEKTRQYAHANQRAIQKFKEIIGNNTIDCNFEEKNAYLYSLDDENSIQSEVTAAQDAGLPAEFLSEIPLPFKVKGAVCFKDQAQFHPLKFLEFISRELTIYEHTMAKNIEKNDVQTDGGVIHADFIVMAAHYPFINMPGYYFMKIHQQRSYVIALDNACQVNGMYRDADENGYSFRNYENLLLVGGGNHRTGENEKGGKYQQLRQAGKNWFPQAQEKASWSAQDCMTLDSVPYIGQYSIATPQMVVATGFNKWGMTGSMVSAMILTDMITGQKNEFAPVFSPQRIDIAASAKKFLENTTEVVSGLASEIFEIPGEDLSKIPNGDAGIVEHKGHKVGVYKTVNGETHMVSTKCTHLGCQLEWNPDEKSWDCPCHGSRFDYKGGLINNPAMKGIQP